MTDIFVGNLPYDVEERDLRGLFERYGRVTSTRVVKDSSTSRCRGFAFVSMPSLDDADEAIRRLSGATLGGRSLNIHEAHSRGDRGDERGPATAGQADRARALKLFDALNS